MKQIKEWQFNIANATFVFDGVIYGTKFYHFINEFVHNEHDITCNVCEYNDDKFNSREVENDPEQISKHIKVDYRKDWDNGILFLFSWKQLIEIVKYANYLKLYEPIDFGQLCGFYKVTINEQNAIISFGGNESNFLMKKDMFIEIIEQFGSFLEILNKHDLEYKVHGLSRFRTRDGNEYINDIDINREILETCSNFIDEKMDNKIVENWTINLATYEIIFDSSRFHIKISEEPEFLPIKYSCGDYNSSNTTELENKFELEQRYRYDQTRYCHINWSKLINIIKESDSLIATNCDGICCFYYFSCNNDTVIGETLSNSVITMSKNMFLDILEQLSILGQYMNNNMLSFRFDNYDPIYIKMLTYTISIRNGTKYYGDMEDIQEHTIIMQHIDEIKRLCSNIIFEPETFE